MLICISSDIFPWLVLQSHKVSLLLVFWWTLKPISIVVVLVYFFTSSLWELFPPLPLHAHQHLWLFTWWLTFSLGWDEISVLFWFAFPLWLRMLNISSYIYSLFVLVRSTQFICSFINWIIFLLFNFLSSGYHPFICWIAAEDFFSWSVEYSRFLWFLFPLMYSFLIWWDTVCLFLLLFLGNWSPILKIIVYTYIFQCFPYDLL
jgi:hypothetical protein